MEDDIQIEIYNLRPNAGYTRIWLSFLKTKTPNSFPATSSHVTLTASFLVSRGTTRPQATRRIRTRLMKSVTRPTFLGVQYPKC